MTPDFVKYQEAQFKACGPRIQALMGAISAYAAEIDGECSDPKSELAATMSIRHLTRDLLWGAWVLGYEYRCQEEATEAVEDDAPPLL